MPSNQGVRIAQAWRRWSGSGCFALLVSLSAASCADETETPLSPEFAVAEDIADRSCAARFSCECDDHSFADYEDCFRGLRAELAERIGTAQGAGLTIDWECIEADEFPLQYGCKLRDEIPFYSQVSSERCGGCRYASGDGEIGELCYDNAGMSTCRAGLTCVPTEAGKRCVDPCTPNEGSPCYFTTDCGEALLCKDGRCAPAKADGEPCNNYNECYTGHLCVNGACVSRSALGEECASSYVCVEDLYCAAEVCAVFPGLGESCAESEECFGDDLYCGPEQVCLAKSVEGESCAVVACGPKTHCDEETALCVRDSPALCLES